MKKLKSLLLFLILINLVFSGPVAAQSIRVGSAVKLNQGVSVSGFTLGNNRELIKSDQQASSKIGKALTLAEDVSELQESTDKTSLKIPIVQRVDAAVPKVNEKFAYWIRPLDDNTPNPTVKNNSAVEAGLLSGEAFIHTVSEVDLSSGQEYNGAVFDLADYVTFNLENLEDGNYTYLLSQLLPDGETSSLFWPDSSVLLITVSKKIVQQSNNSAITYGYSIVNYKDKEGSKAFDGTKNLKNLTLPGVITADILGNTVGKSEFLNGLGFTASLIGPESEGNTKTISGVSDGNGLINFSDLSLGISKPGIYKLVIKQNLPSSNQNLDKTNDLTSVQDYFDSSRLYLYDQHAYEIALEVEGQPDSLTISSVAVNGSPEFFTQAGLEISQEINSSAASDISCAYTLNLSGNDKESGDIYLYNGSSLKRVEKSEEIQGGYNFNLSLSSPQARFFGLKSGQEYSITLNKIPDSLTIAQVKPAVEQDGRTVNGKFNLKENNTVSFSLTQKQSESSQVKPATIVIPGLSTLESDNGESLTVHANDFSFLISPSAGNPEADPVPESKEQKDRTVKSQENGKLEFFKDLNFTKPGVYNYTIIEKDTNNTKGIISDNTEYSVKLVVEKELNKDALEVKEKVIQKTNSSNEIFDSLDFHNTKSNSQVSYSVTAQKKLEGGVLKNDDFEFAISSFDAASEEFLPEKVIVRASSSGVVSFPNIVFNKPGVFSYRVYEVIPEEKDRNQDIIYDQTVYTVRITIEEVEGILTRTGLEIINEKEAKKQDAVCFINKIRTEEISESHVVSLKAQAEVRTDSQDEFKLKENQFSFKLTPSVSNVNDPVSKSLSVFNDAKGNISLLDDISFNSPGLYKYKVSENSTGIEGVTVDSSVYEVAVNIEDGKEPEITFTKNQGPVSKLDSSNPIVFTNTYERISKERAVDQSSSSVVIKGESLYNGQAAKAGLFSYKIKAKDPLDAPLPSADTVNNETGQFSFAEINFTKPGTYIYDLVEIEGSDPNILYDHHKYKIKVNVTESNNQLNQEWFCISLDNKNLGQGIRFRNYKADSADTIKAQLVVKTDSGKPYELKGGEFDFSIEPVTSVAQDPINPRIITNSKDGAINLITEIPFNDGKYSYRVKEVKGNNSKFKYDTTSYIYTITSSNGRKEFTVRNESNGEPEDNPVFTNIYKDNSNKDKEEQKTITKPSSESDKDTVEADLNKETSSGSKKDSQKETDSNSGSDKLSVKSSQAVNGQEAEDKTSVKKGDVITYTITAKNNTDSLLTDITLTNKIPSGVTVDKDSLSLGGRLGKDGTVSWKIPTLAKNDSYQASFDAEVNDKSGTITSVATASTIKDGEVKSNTLTAEGPENTKVKESNSNDENSADELEEETAESKENISFVKTQAIGDGTATEQPLLIDSGDVITYKIKLTNNSGKTLKDLTVEDTVAPDLELIDEGNGTIIEEDSGDTITWSIDELRDKGSSTFAFQAQVPSLNADDTVIYPNVSHYSFDSNKDTLIDSNKVIASNNPTVLEEEKNSQNNSSNTNTSDQEEDLNASDTSEEVSGSTIANPSTQENNTDDSGQASANKTSNQTTPVSGTAQTTSNPTKVVRTVSTTTETTSTKTPVTANAQTGVSTTVSITIWLVVILIAVGLLLFNIYSYNKNKNKDKKNK